MTIRLTPEDEKLIEGRIESGVFRSVQEVIHDALASQDAEARWMIQNKDAIGEKIVRGIAQLDRGEGIPAHEARVHLHERKAKWLADKGE